MFLRLMLIVLTMGLLALSQAPKQRPAPPPAATDAQPQEPPEEDVSLLLSKEFTSSTRCRPRKK